jgi:predicted HicB family RNase H-like nuclease
MRKEDRIGVRVSGELKKSLSQIAKSEDRSLAQVCELFLRDGVSSYKEYGAKFFLRLLSRQNKDADV